RIDGAAPVARRSLVEAVPRAILGNLDLTQQQDGVTLGASVAHAVLPAARGVLVFEVPAIPTTIWLRHLALLTPSPRRCAVASTGPYLHEPPDRERTPSLPRDRIGAALRFADE